MRKTYGNFFYNFGTDCQWLKASLLSRAISFRLTKHREASRLTMAPILSAWAILESSKKIIVPFFKASSRLSRPSYESLRRQYAPRSSLAGMRRGIFSVYGRKCIGLKLQ